MTLWLDGDGCPRAVRDIVFRFAVRLELEAVFVANRAIQLPRSRWIRSVLVPQGFDVADHHILSQAAPGDVVVSGDVPLAAALVARGVHVIGPRGEEFTEDNVGERQSTRDLLAALRDQGAITGGPAAYGEADRRNLASSLDRLLTRLGAGRPR